MNESHPLFNAPEDLLACLALGERYGRQTVLAALDIRMRLLASAGDKRVEVLVEIADFLGVRVQLV